jgi:hypothetical protein
MRATTTGLNQFGVWHNIVPGASCPAIKKTFTLVMMSPIAARH